MKLQKARVIIAKQSIIPILLLGTSCATLQFCSLAPVISFGFKRLKGFETLSNGREQSVSDINSSSLAKTIFLIKMRCRTQKASAKDIIGKNFRPGFFWV